MRKIIAITLLILLVFVHAMPPCYLTTPDFWSEKLPPATYTINSNTAIVARVEIYFSDGGDQISGCYAAAPNDPGVCINVTQSGNQVTVLTEGEGCTNLLAALADGVAFYYEIVTSASPSPSPAATTSQEPIQSSSAAPSTTFPSASATSTSSKPTVPPTAPITTGTTTITPASNAPPTSASNAPSSPTPTTLEPPTATTTPSFPATTTKPITTTHAAISVIATVAPCTAASTTSLAPSTAPPIIPTTSTLKPHTQAPEPTAQSHAPTTESPGVQISGENNARVASTSSAKACAYTLIGIAFFIVL